MDVYPSLAILEQRHGELDRKMADARPFHAVAERELVDEDVVVRVQLALVERVVHIDVEPAAGDRITRVLAGVGREIGELDAFGLGRDVEEGHRRERIDRAFDIDRRIAIQLALQGERGRWRASGGTERTDLAGE